MLSFDRQKVEVISLLTGQSDDIALGVNTGGAGDQGTMVGYATNEHESYLPLPIALAHALMIQHAKILETKEGSELLGPDAKAQVTIRYREGVAEHCKAVVFSAQHAERDISIIRNFLRKNIIDKVIPKSMINRETEFFINPTGKFVLGGPLTDTGLTGRKIVIDCYGNLARHGGGAFSGKDPTKVDRSGAYLCRYLAKNIVAAKLASRCEVQISYAIGHAEPVSIVVDTFGTETVPTPRIISAIEKLAFLSPLATIEHLRLKRPIYRATASFGHFGRTDPNFTWEQLDLVDHFAKIS